MLAACHKQEASTNASPEPTASSEEVIDWQYEALKKACAQRDTATADSLIRVFFNDANEDLDQLCDLLSNVSSIDEFIAIQRVSIEWGDNISYRCNIIASEYEDAFGEGAFDATEEWPEAVQFIQLIEELDQIGEETIADFQALGLMKSEM